MNTCTLFDYVGAFPFSDQKSEDGSSTINTFPGGVSLSDSSVLQLSPLEGSDEPVLQLTQATGRPKGLSDNSVEYSIEPLGKGSTDDLRYRMVSDSTEQDPDDFCVIDTVPKGSSFPGGLDPALDVNALQAKLSQLNTSGGKTTPTSNGMTQEGVSIGPNNGGRSTGCSPLSQEVQEVEDMTIEGGATHNVTVNVSTPRTIVGWQFVSQPKGIAVGLNYRERDSTRSMEVWAWACEHHLPTLSPQILPVRRVMSHKTMLTGEHVAQKAGLYTLVFSNTHSKLVNIIVYIM